MSPKCYVLFLLCSNKLVIKSIRLESCRKTSPCLISKLCEPYCSKFSRNYIIWFQSPDYELMNVSVASWCVRVLLSLKDLCSVSWIDKFYYFKSPERAKNLTKNVQLKISLSAANMFEEIYQPYLCDKRNRN